MFSQGCSRQERVTLQHHLINSTCKRASSESTMEDILSITDNAHRQDPKTDEHCTSRLLTNLWETQREDGYQTNENPGAREFCGHTTCRETCLFQVYKTPKAPEAVRGGDILVESKQSLSNYYVSEQPEFEWDTLMLNSPAEMQGGGLDTQDEQCDDVLSEIDCSMRQMIDTEIEAFRSNLHNMLSEQQHQYRQILTSENTQTKDQRTVYGMSSSRNIDVAWSPMNLSEQPQVEESSSSNYSMQDEDVSHLYHQNNRQEDEVNSILIQLMTSASIVSHALRRHEYAT